MTNPEKIVISQKIGWTLVGMLITSLATVTWMYVGFRLSLADTRIEKLEPCVVQNTIHIEVMLKELSSLTKSIETLIKERRQ